MCFLKNALKNWKTEKLLIREMALQRKVIEILCFVLPKKEGGTL